MNCQEVKEQIENNTLIDPFIIFVCKHNKFLANQYVNAIKNNLGISYITYLEKLENNNNFADIFNIKESSSTDTLRVFNTDKLIINTDAFINEKNLIIITNTIDDETASLYRNYIVELPKLEENSSNMSNQEFIEEISKRLSEEVEPQTIELTDYEKRQEEEAIISYKELLKVKDRLYKITDDEEIDTFIDELKEFRTNLNEEEE